MRLDLNQRPLRPENEKCLCTTRFISGIPDKYSVFQFCSFLTYRIIIPLFTGLCTKCAPNFTLIKCIADALPEKPITHYLSQLSIRVVYCKILSLILL